MASELPLLVSDCPAQATLINDTNSGVVFEAENEQSLAKAIIDLYHSPEERAKMGLAGKAAVLSTYSWDYTGKVLIDHYQSLKKDFTENV